MRRAGLTLRTPRAAMESDVVSKQTTKKESHPVSDNVTVQLPSRSALMLTAAIVSQGATKRPADAVNYALRLWVEAGKTLQAEARANEQLGFEGISLPKKFPASLDDFLSLIVRARTPADSMKRLRDFFRDKTVADLKTGGFDGPVTPDDNAQVETAVEQDIKRLGDYGISKTKWGALAKHYYGWWARQKSAKSGAAAKKRLTG